MLIKNRDSLLEHGNRRGREQTLDILEAGLRAADPYESVKRLVRIEGNILRVGGNPEMDVSGYGDEEINLDEIEQIYVIGAGKAVQRQAKALEDILGDRLTGGAITAKKGEGCYLERIQVTEGAHPVPDEDSILGARRIVEIAEKATERDLVFTIFSDGASSLFALPDEPYTLEDMRALYKLSIKYGNQTIITRPMAYFSKVNCGRIVKLLQPARSINLILCTVPYMRWHGKTPKTKIFVPTWPPGERRMEEDIASFQAEPWYPELPPKMKLAFDTLDQRREVPDLAEWSTYKASFWQPVDSHQMVLAAKAKADELGVNGQILGLWSLVNAAETAHVLGGIARECAMFGMPFEPPVALISTGELTVPIGNAKGVGGRNQEFVLRTAAYLAGRSPSITIQALQTGIPVIDTIVVGSVDSDGTDGPGTQFGGEAPEDFRCQAGALADSSTFPRADELGINILEELREHNSSIPLFKMGDSVYTGNTGTCVGDLRVILVMGRYQP